MESENTYHPNRDEDILDAIKKKEKGWKRTRLNRISASERLKGYSQKWAVITFMFNVEAVLFMIVSLKYPLHNGLDAAFSGFFSLYVILLQYYLTTLNYEAKSLKFHYEQLQIENLRLRLKKLYYSDRTLQEIEEIYTGIVNEYQEGLTGYENHTQNDDLKTEAKIKDRINSEDKKTAKIRDFSLDNVFIYVNFGIEALSLISFLGLYFFTS